MHFLEKISQNKYCSFLSIEATNIYLILAKLFWFNQRDGFDEILCLLYPAVFSCILQTCQVFLQWLSACTIKITLEGKLEVARLHINLCGNNHNLWNEHLCTISFLFGRFDHGKWSKFCLIRVLKVFWVTWYELWRLPKSEAKLCLLNNKAL